MNTYQPFETPKILLILPLENPSATIYIIKPLENLQSFGYIEFITKIETEIDLVDIHASDLVIFCRNQDPEYNWILEECLNRKIATIYNLDDNLWEVPEELFYSAFHRETKHIKQLEKYITKVDLVIVYSQHLKNKVTSLNNNVIVAKPCIDIYLTSPVPIQNQDNKIHLTYVTGRGNTDPLLSVISEALLKINNLYGNQIEMHWWGEIPKQFEAFPNSHLEFINHDYNDFLHSLSHAGYDIGLAPLLHTDFYYSKTNTKFRDYAAARIAGIYSDHPVYSDVIHEQTGLLVQNDPDAWFASIKRLIEDGELRFRIKQQAYQFVKENYHQSKLENQWLDVINTLLSDHERFASSYPSKKHAETSSIKLSLGVNHFVTPGFQTIARFPSPGVSIIADLYQPLPIKSNCVSQLEIFTPFSSRSEFIQFMQEIYRVSQHLAQIGFLAPYTEPNDKFNQEIDYPIFNEFTPAEWTTEHSIEVLDKHFENHPETRIPGIDIRLVDYELFKHSSEHVQNESKLRTGTTISSNKIFYQCLVVKGNSDVSQQLKMPDKFFEPAYIHVYRLKQLNQRLSNQLKDFWKVINNNEELKLNLSETQKELIAYQQKNTELTSSNAHYQKDVSLGRILANDMDTFRNRKLFSLIDRIFNHADLSKDLPETMQKLVDDSFIFLPSLKGYRLKTSQNLNLVSHLSYKVHLPKRKITGIYLAAILDISSARGTLHIEISAHNNQIIAHSEIQTNTIERDHPTRFSFLPFTPESPGIYTLRVFTRNVDIPIRLFEWQKNNFLEIRRPQSEPFISYIFE